MSVLVRCCLYWMLCSFQQQEEKLPWLHALARKYIFRCILTTCRIHKFCGHWCSKTRNTVHENLMDHLSSNLFGIHIRPRYWPLHLPHKGIIFSQRDWRDTDIWQVLETKSRLWLTCYSWSVLWRHSRVWEAVKILQIDIIW